MATVAGVSGAGHASAFRTTEHIAMSIVDLRPPGASRLGLALASLAAGGVLAGCGGHGGGGGASSSPTPDAYQQALKFSQCMRAHGVNFPDPQSVNGGQGVTVRVTPGAGDAQLNPDSTQFQHARNACKQYLPNGGQLSPEQQAQQQQNALKYAQCMRAHGVDVPDPQPGSGGLVIRGGSGNGAKVNPDDPKFQAAQQACQSLLGNPSTGGGLNIQKGG